MSKQKKDLNKVIRGTCLFPCDVLTIFQAQNAVNNQNAKVEQLASQVNAADDEVFADFCRRIRVNDIREYEDVQLKAAQEENDALLKYKTQIARLEHQSVIGRVSQRRY